MGQTQDFEVVRKQTRKNPTQLKIIIWTQIYE